MRYWWVNQNQTYRHEISGGYLWSPKRKANNQRNVFYEFMREVAPGDVIFSFVDTRIAAIGVARSFCFESPKPIEFGTVGMNWGPIGWKVDVAYIELTNRIRPKDHIRELRPLLPSLYAPLQDNGNGSQTIYLTELPSPLASALLRLVGTEASRVVQTGGTVGASIGLESTSPIVEEWERRVEIQIANDRRLEDTERTALVQARRGQGVFRSNVRRVERACRITKVERLEHLVASHTKPWRDASNEERLNGENGFLLTPTIDHLFDEGFISFENNGDVILSPVAHRPALARMGVAIDRVVNVGTFSEGQKGFLDYHRENVLRLARVREAGRDGMAGGGS